MTSFLLIRHASHDLLGKALAGRSDIPLNAAGVREAARLAERLQDANIERCFSSPSRRARETAGPIATKFGLELHIHDGLAEIDFGAWTGQTFPALEADPAWAVWVNRRSLAQPPGGETIKAVQQRVIAALRELAPGGGRIALVSHGDVIKVALAEVVGISLDHLERFEVAPGSVSEIAMDGAWARIESLNSKGTVFSR